MIDSPLRLILIFACAGGAGLHAAAPAAPTAPPAPIRIGTVDLFGMRQVPEATIRGALKLRVSDPFIRAEAAAAAKALEQLPGVTASSFAAITTDGNGEIHLFVGIQETATKGFEFGAAPTGEEKLPPALRATYDAAMQALGPAVRSGRATDDNSQGHSLTSDPAMRKAQLAAIELVRADVDTVRRVLHQAADAQERTAAAWLLGYAPDKRTITADLVAAARDPDSTVRNNATRALGAIAELAAKQPALGIRIDPTVFIDMLDSLTWTDRNKGLFVVEGLTKSPSPELFAALRARALPDLIEMARWKSTGHALAAVFILGHLAGWDEMRAMRDYDQGKLDALIAAAWGGTAPRK